MKYNIIGDIHGRTVWEDLIDDEAINVFVGDYFSPYHYDITWEQQKQNFINIVNYKIEHPDNVILLIGNHDEDHWHWIYTGCSRHNFEHEEDIRSLFEKYKHLFQAAYAIDNKYLITHAGLSILWLYKYLYNIPNHDIYNTLMNLNFPMYESFNTIEEAIKHDDEIKHRIEQEPIEHNLALWKNKWYEYVNKKWKKVNITPDKCVKYVNKLWKNNPNAFSFTPNYFQDDYYGTTPLHSPMWIRVGYYLDDGLLLSNIFKGTYYVQVFGHTISNDMQEYYDYTWINEHAYQTNTGQMIMCDCLEEKNKCYKIIIDTEKC